MELYSTHKRPMRAKLIFNPIAGAPGKSPVQLMDVINEMQAWKLVPEAFLIEPGCNLTGVVQDALAEGGRGVLRADPSVAVPLGLPVPDAYAVHHARAREPVVGVGVRRRDRVRPVAQVAAVQPDREQVILHGQLEYS